MPGQIAQCPTQGRKETRHARPRVDGRLFGMGIDIDEPAVHLPIGGVLPQGLDRRLKRLVVEDAAIQQDDILRVQSDLFV